MKKIQESLLIVSLVILVIGALIKVMHKINPNAFITIGVIGTLAAAAWMISDRMRNRE